MIPRSHLVVLALVAASAASCSGGEGGGWLSEGLTARRSVLADLSERVIVPTVEELRTAGAELAGAARTLASTPSADSLARARDAWRAGRAAWNSSEAFLVDPPFDPGYLAKIDTSPIDDRRLESILSGGGAIDRSLLASLGSTLKGFFAVEYLLFGEREAPEEVLARLTAGEAGARRCAYLAAAAEELAGDMAFAAEQWSPAGRDLASALSRDQDMMLERLANRLAVLTETIADRRLGRPLGKTSGGLPQPDGAESERSGNTRRDVLDDLAGLRNAYFGLFAGRRSLGLEDLVRPASEDLDGAYRAALDAAIASVEAIPEPLTEALETDLDTVERAFQATKALARSTATDLVSGLGASLGFSPFDGD